MITSELYFTFFSAFTYQVCVFVASKITHTNIHAFVILKFLLHAHILSHCMTFKPTKLITVYLMLLKIVKCV